MNRRFIQLFKLLAKQKEYIKSDDLCTQLNIRPRTLREDIRLYKEMIEKEAGCIIKSKPNAGYFLQVENEELYNTFLKRLLQEEANNQYLIPVHQEERINYIIRYFLAHHGYVKLNDLADKIYISRSTLNADIKEVKERLSYFNLELTSKAGYGLKIKGKEKNIRSCMAQYFYHFENYDQQYLQGMDIQSKFIDSNAFSFIKTLLYEIISQYEFKLTDFGFQNLSIHLLIAVNRIKEKTYIEDIEKDYSIFEDRIESKIATSLANSLNQYFNIHIPQSEIHYITIHLMGKQAMEFNQQHIFLEQKTLDLVDLIFKEIRNVFNIDLSNDIDLHTMIMMHLQPMLNRLQYDLKMNNPLTQQIKKDNALAFEMATVAGNLIHKEMKKHVSDDELGYLALHFALALERRQKPIQKNVIIVCASGAGSSQILLYKVKTQFKEHIDRVLVTQAYKLNEIDQKDFDFILSTIPIPFKTEIPVIQVQYFLDDESINQIEQVLFKNQSEYDFIQHCFREEYFFTQLKGETKEEVILEMCQKIHAIHPLPDNFTSLIFQREAVSSTEIGNHVATPHPISLVMDQTFVAIGILDHAIKWDKKMVKIVFLLCIKKNSDEALSIFNEVLSSLILNNERILELEKNPSFKTIQRHIKSLSKEKIANFEDSIFQ